MTVHAGTSTPNNSALKTVLYIITGLHKRCTLNNWCTRGLVYTNWNGNKKRRKNVKDTIKMIPQWTYVVVMKRKFVLPRKIIWSRSDLGVQMNPDAIHMQISVNACACLFILIRFISVFLTSALYLVLQRMTLYIRNKMKLTILVHVRHGD